VAGDDSLPLPRRSDAGLDIVMVHTGIDTRSAAARREGGNMIDRETYFTEVRDSLFGGVLTQQQVDGQSVILAVWEFQAGGVAMTDPRWLAYMLATTFHETAARMWPTTEYGSQSYLEGKDYWPYIGRGFVQLTWESNYDKASNALGLVDDRDLVDHPEVALDSLISCRIMFRGMAEGWFTGVGLGDYFNDTVDDPVNARRIINGNDKDELIAGYHQTFLAALEVASASVW
jgi:putative chitinase